MTLKLCIMQRVQLMLKASEKTDKSDDSPVTVADYGEALSVIMALSCCCTHALAGLPPGIIEPLNVLSCSTGAQALVAWSLQKEMPNLPFSMVAEEDSDDLRCHTHNSSSLLHISDHDGLPLKGPTARTEHLRHATTPGAVTGSCR